MVSNSNLPLSLWSEAIKTATYVLNRVPTKVIPKKPFELWKGWKPSLRHVHVWGCPVEVRIYNPQEKKLDSRTVGGYFISYAEKSKRYRFYCPSRATKIVESHNASHQDLTIQETPVLNEPHHEDILVDSVIQHPKQGNVDITLRRSTRDRRFIISSYYVVYLQEYDIDIGVEDDPITFSQVVGGSESTLWYNSMKDEMNSMANNQVWDPVELPKVQRSLVVNGCLRLKEILWAILKDIR
ncbi:Copia protein [Vitis vinifera]|uniref:Copia protein n=1 Tax=Vitis vinifera TaxID=29760 RepID=A0A438EUE9_VITVI|nr:Copia protein [Vitis vinifera]